MSGGGDALFWERRRADLDYTCARSDAARCAREAAAALAFVEWWAAYQAARFAALARLRLRRERVAARIALERARDAPLTTVARRAAGKRARQRDDDECAARRHLGHAAAAAQRGSRVAVALAQGADAIAAARRIAAASAASAVERALRLVWRRCGAMRGCRLHCGWRQPNAACRGCMPLT